MPDENWEGEAPAEPLYERHAARPPIVAWRLRHFRDTTIEPPPMASLFVYGTLLDPGLVERLLGRPLSGRPARLHGYRRTTHPAQYPDIEPSPTDIVEGQLLTDLDDAGLALLDRYEDEGRLYRRTRVDVVVEDRVLSTFSYVGMR